MARIRTYKTEGFVVRQLALGEADRILTFYTPDLGKVRAVAKGVRRPKSKLAGHLELLNQVALSLSHGRNLDVVNETQVVRSFIELREDLDRLSRALYVAELIDGFSSERSPNYGVYKLLEHTLERLAVEDAPDLLLRYFELQLLDQSGFRPELYECVECRFALEPADHLFTCAGGGAVCPNCRSSASGALIPLPQTAMKVLRFMLRERSYAGVAGLRVSPDQMREVERLTRAHLHFVIERELKSVDFMTLVTSGRAEA